MFFTSKIGDTWSASELTHFNFSGWWVFKRESLGITEIYSAAECLRVQNDQLDDNKTIVANCRNKTIINKS